MSSRTYLKKARIAEIAFGLAVVSNVPRVCHLRPHDMRPRIRCQSSRLGTCLFDRTDRSRTSPARGTSPSLHLRRVGNMAASCHVIKTHDSGCSEEIVSSGETAMVAGIGACASGRLVGFASV
jgi:hypothetical protein